MYIRLTVISNDLHVELMKLMAEELMSCLIMIHYARYQSHPIDIKQQDPAHRRVLNNQLIYRSDIPLDLYLS